MRGNQIMLAATPSRGPQSKALAHLWKSSPSPGQSVQPRPEGGTSRGSIWRTVADCHSRDHPSARENSGEAAPAHRSASSNPSPRRSIRDTNARIAAQLKSPGPATYEDNAVVAAWRVPAAVPAGEHRGCSAHRRGTAPAVCCRADRGACTDNRQLSPVPRCTGRAQTSRACPARRARRQ